MRRPPPPPGFESISGPDAPHSHTFGFSLPEERAFIEAELARAGSLAAASTDWADPLLLGGRGSICAARPVSSSPERWVVRPYLRGGAVAALLVDRHLAVGTPRPWIEQRALAALARTGIPSLEVVAGVVHRSGIWYRAEIVTRFVPATRTLADALFAADGGDEALSGPERARRLRQAAELCRRLAAAGVWHLDLNARNLLLEGDGMRVIDLDRARTDVADRARAERAMTSRLARSLRKFEGRTGRALQAEEWLAFDSAAPTDPSEA